VNEHAYPTIGHNQPPPEDIVRNSIIAADASFDILNNFLSDNPVIEDHRTAQNAKSMLDNTKSVLDQMESERDSEVRPLNERVKAINAIYKQHRESLERLVGDLKARLNAFLEKIEAERRAEAERLAQEKAEAERRAQEKIDAENEARDDASQGAGADIGTAIRETDEAMADLDRANRAAEIAVRDAERVRINDGFGGRALSRRTRENLYVTDAVAAVKDIVKLRGEIPEKLADVICGLARDYRKGTGKLPKGVESMVTKSL